jgi:hypothetical protein
MRDFGDYCHGEEEERAEGHSEDVHVVVNGSRWGRGGQCEGQEGAV